MKHSLLRNTIIKLFKQGHSNNLKTLLEKINPADLALILPNIDVENKKALFEHYVTDKQAAKIISKLRDKNTISNVIAGLKRQRISEIFKHIEPDDAAYILNTLSVRESEALLKLMKQDDADDINKVLRFSPETCGGIMNSAFIAVKEDSTIEQCIKELRKTKDKNDEHYIYITDTDGVIKGKVKARDAFRHPLEVKVSEIMDDHLVYLQWDATHKELIHTAYRYGLPEIPIVNRTRMIVGVVSTEHIFKIARKETASNILKSAGLIDLKELHKINMFSSIKAKLLLMLLSTITGFAAAVGINYYLENTSVNSATIAFVPLVVFISYAISNSSIAILLRELFFERINAEDISSFKDITTEIKSGIFYGLVTALLAAAYSFLFLTNNIKTDVLCATGIFLSCLSASFVGPFISTLIIRAGIRPTRMAIPVIVLVAIIISLTIYLWSTNYLYYTNVIPNSWTIPKF